MNGGKNTKSGVETPGNWQLWKKVDKWILDTLIRLSKH